MKQPEEIVVAVIGCGYWGKNLVRNFHALGALGAISDPDPDVQARMQKEFNIAACDVDEILANHNIDAVVIAVPAEHHHDIAIRALRVGKHVFIEKPIALTLTDAQEICDTATQVNKTLMIGHLLQYHPVFLKLKEMVRGGKIGKLRYLYSRRLNIGKLRVHENVLWSFAPHDISMILTLVGHEPVSIHGFSGNFLQDSVSDFASVQMAFPHGIKAHIEVSWLNPFKEQRLVVVGDKGMIEFNDQADWGDKLKFYNHQAEVVNGLPVVTPAKAETIEVEPGEPLRNECRHFLKFIATGETPYTDGREAIAVLRVLRAGDAAHSGWVGSPFE